MSSEYDRHLYPTKAQPQLHIDNLYTQAFLHGFNPPPVESSSVLEIGCGTGLNLLPMAKSLPHAEFIGVDYAERPIQIARSLAERMGITNVRFHHADICDLADDFGSFGYILAHGFYSWVPLPAREALWRVARGSLSPHGVLHVSYNALPGWAQHQSLRDLCLLHMSHFADHDTQLREAWHLIEALAPLKETESPVAVAAAQTIQKGFAIALHDELGEINQPFYFHQILNHAQSAGLTYITDAVPKFLPGLHRLPEGEAILAHATADRPLLRQQYEDFFAMRAFRQSLFTPASGSLTPLTYCERLRQCHVTSPLRVGPPGEDGNRLFDSPHTMLAFQSENPLLGALFESIAEAAPAPIPLDTAFRQLARAFPNANPATVAEFWELAEDLSRNGVLQVHSWQRPIPATVPTLPAMAGIARWEALMDLPMTNFFHRSEPFPDPFHQALAALADGSRSVSEIVDALATLLPSSHTKAPSDTRIDGFPVALPSSKMFPKEPAILNDPQALRALLSHLVPEELEKFRLAALLV